MKNRQPTVFKCDFCHSNRFDIRLDIKTKLDLQVEGYEIIECSNCHLVSLFPQPTQQKILTFYKDYASKKNREETESIRKETVYPEKLKMLKQYAKGNRLLDIGAGLGTFAFMAGKEGFDVTGIELSEEQCKAAKKEYDLDLLMGDIYEVKNHIGTFDIIYLHHVMEHLTSPSSMFDIFSELLNPDGILLIEVPYQLNRIQDSFGKLTKKKMQYPFDHLFFFSPRTMKNYVQKNGFQVMTFHQHRPEKFEGKLRQLPPYLLRRLFHELTTLLWFPSGSFIEVCCCKKHRTQ